MAFNPRSLDKMSVTRWQSFSAEPLTRGQRSEIKKLNKTAHRSHANPDRLPIRLRGAHGQVIELTMRQVKA
jgi:hypothetical protein